MHDGFIFYESFRDAMRELPAETQLVLYNAIADYALYDEVPDFGNDGIAKGFFALMRPQIDANNRKRENGSRGGRPVKETEQEPIENQTQIKPETSDKQSITEAKPNDNLGITKAEPNAKEKAKENAKDKAKEKECCADGPRRFTKPTVDEIRVYCRERGNAIDAQRFFDFYEAKGWRVGSQPMKDWQAAVRTWEWRDSARRHDQADGYARKGAKPRIEQHDFNDDDLAHLLVDLDAEPQEAG
ncbi:hypothetical protein SDC9_121511 [bioreactor metagenome]|uniref:DUF6291 domain-containing protein n=1 Tax=bioreactor metagenome TaxID=1076179 RepID=A0A645CC72_9ZZZZ